MSYHLKPEHLKAAEALVDRARANGGLAPVDLAKFWEDQERAMADPWASDCPQVPLGIFMARDCIFDELGIPEDFTKLFFDTAFVAAHAKTYNDKAERTVGRRLLGEPVPQDPTRQYPATKQLSDLFEAKNVWNIESYWLTQSAHSESELAALLDRVESRLQDLRAFALPAGWDEEKRRLLSLGVRPPLMRSLRGPVTFATSIYGAENLIFLFEDNPDLAARFRDVLQRSILGLAAMMDEEAEIPPGEGRGWWWADDNCALLTPAMYEAFGYPILKAVFEKYAPEPGDSRFQHSDSDMAHLLPLLGKLALTAVNFGPKLTVSEIREHLPRAVIQGQLAPFTFSRNEEVNIVAEFLRDFEMAREKRGLVFATSGSINNGSRLTGLRLIMSAIQTFGRY